MPSPTQAMRPFFSAAMSNRAKEKKPSAVQSRSYGSVRIAYLDRAQVLAEVKSAAERLVREREDVLAVGLFGSLARGEALPSSDVDVLIVLRAHPKRRWFDRIPEFEGAFSQVSLHVEIFPYTQEELDTLAARPGLVRTALKDLLHLAGDAEVWESVRKNTS